MNTSQLNKVNELLTVGIPKKDREMRAHHGNIVYVDPTHVMLAKTTLRESPELEYHKFIGPSEGEISGDPLRFCREHNKKVVVNRKFLMQILQAMDCDNVILYADEECPIGIVGMMAREMLIEGVIGPIVSGSTQDDPEVFYD